MFFNRHFIFKSCTPENGERIKVHPDVSCIEHSQTDDGIALSWLEPATGLDAFIGEVSHTFTLMLGVFLFAIAAGAGFIIGVSLVGAI